MPTEWTLERMQLMASRERTGLDDLELPPLHPAIERQLRLVRLRRLIARRSSELALSLGEDAANFFGLLKLVAIDRRRRELAYFRMGYEVGRAGEVLVASRRGW